VAEKTLVNKKTQTVCAFSIFNQKMKIKIKIKINSKIDA